jgi:hypothetical protein
MQKKERGKNSAENLKDDWIELKKELREPIKKIIQASKEKPKEKLKKEKKIEIDQSELEKKLQQPTEAEEPQQFIQPEIQPNIEIEEVRAPVLERVNSPRQNRRDSQPTPALLRPDESLEATVASQPATTSQTQQAPAQTPVETPAQEIEPRNYPRNYYSHRNYFESEAIRYEERIAQDITPFGPPVLRSRDMRGPDLQRTALPFSEPSNLQNAAVNDSKEVAENRMLDTTPEEDGRPFTERRGRRRRI